MGFEKERGRYSRVRPLSNRRTVPLTMKGSLHEVVVWCPAGCGVVHDAIGTSRFSPVREVLWTLDKGADVQRRTSDPDWQWPSRRMVRKEKRKKKKIC
jgi:hypothetical protein